MGGIGEEVTITIGLAIWVGVTALALSRWLRVPPLLFFVTAGMALGPMGLNWLKPESLGKGLPILVEFGLAVILFEGAMNLPGNLQASLSRPARRLLGAVIPLTAVLTFLVAAYGAQLNWTASAVFASFMVVTGPTTIGPLLRSLAIRRRLEVILRLEAIWGDCVGILLASVLLPLWIQNVPVSFTNIPVRLLGHAALSVGIGIASSLVLSKVVMPAMARLGEADMAGMVSLSFVILAFAGARALSPGTGPIAAAIAGYGFAVMRPPFVREIRLFKAQVAYLFIAMFFVLLSSLLDLRPFGATLGRLTATALFLSLVVRPASVLLGFLGSEVPWEERLYLAFIGPRGIVALATASYLVTQRRGDPAALELFALSFLLIFFSSGSASLAGRPLAKLLGVNIAEYRTGLIIVGANEFTAALASILAEQIPVRVLDSDPAKLAFAAREGIEQIVANALDESVYEEAAELGYRRILAATPNDTLNAMILEHAEPTFGAQRVFRVLSRDSQTLVGSRPGLLRRVAFPEGFSLEALGRAPGWTLRQVKQARPDQVPLVSLAQNGVRIIRAGSEEEGPFIVLEWRPAAIAEHKA